MSQQSPFETILENTRLSSFDLIFSKIIFFFLQFSPSRGLQTTLASWTETETNAMTSLILNNCMIPPFYLNVVTISKYFNLIFLYFNFQNYPVNPVNQYYLDHQFCHFSTAKILSWCMAAIRKMVFKRKSNAFPINLWNKILRHSTASFYSWKHLRYSHDLRPLNLQLYWWNWNCGETKTQPC